MKDDSCSNCRNDDNLDYHTMWLALELSGRPMVLTVEGNPDDALISKGGYGNAKRVGHDISPNWDSMTSLIDIGAPLWPYAHGSTDPTFGGWWNASWRWGPPGLTMMSVAARRTLTFSPRPCPSPQDLDMIEVGNAART